MNSEELGSLLDRLVERKQTEADIVALRQVLIDVLSGVASEQQQVVIQLGKYNVNIVEGKELRIGDRTFLEVNDETMKALTRVLPPPNQFKSLIEDKTKNFVGREFIFKSIDNLLADADFSSGYIVISGEPGIGKSSVIAQFIKTRGAVHHFNSVLMNIRSPKDFLENICTQLIVRYDLNYPALPPEAGKDSGFLSKLLAEIANQKQQQPVVILVDALDEAEDTSLPPGANRLFLPPNLPEGIFLIVTSREEYDYRLDVAHRKDIYLRDDDPRNLEDVRLYIRNYIQEHQPKMLPHIEQWGVSQDEFVDVITEKSEGNFMYLYYVLHDIRDGKLTQSNVDSIHNLPKGLQSYYQRHWREMEVQDPQKFQSYYEPVVCQLAVAREPVSVNQLSEWTKLPPKSIKEVIHDWHEFFNKFTPETGDSLYRIYHASFQTFLREDIGLKPYEKKVVQTAFNKIQW
jgi:serine/threonine-protein kinase